MSLDVSLTYERPKTAFMANITHNLGEMASQVKLEKGLTLYDVLWRPDENNLYVAYQLIELLDEGLTQLVDNPVLFRKYAPENGWGTYKGLVKFVAMYLVACENNRDADVSVSR
jgi:hypothetical protein